MSNILNLQRLWHRLKRNRLASNVLQRLDIIRADQLPGTKWKIYYRLLSNHWVRGDYEQTARASFLRVCRHFQIEHLFDLGANVGIYTVDFTSFSDQGRLVAVEPNPRVYPCLAKTVQGIGSRAVALQMAVADKAGEVEIFFDPLSPALGGIVPGEDGLFNSQRNYGGFVVSHTVPAVTVDMLAQEYFVPQFIKIDVEGAEYCVFKGGSATIPAHKPVLFFECSRDSQQSHQLLSQWGYRLFNENLKPIEGPEFVSFALHKDKHASLIRELV